MNKHYQWLLEEAGGDWCLGHSGDTSAESLKAFCGSQHERKWEGLRRSAATKRCGADKLKSKRTGCYDWRTIQLRWRKFSKVDTCVCPLCKGSRRAERNSTEHKPPQYLKPRLTSPLHTFLAPKPSSSRQRRQRPLQPNPPLPSKQPAVIRARDYTWRPPTKRLTAERPFKSRKLGALQVEALLDGVAGTPGAYLEPTTPDGEGLLGSSSACQAPHPRRPARGSVAPSAPAHTMLRPRGGAATAALVTFSPAHAPALLAGHGLQEGGQEGGERGDVMVAGYACGDFVLLPPTAPALSASWPATCPPPQPRPSSLLSALRGLWAHAGAWGGAAARQEQEEPPAPAAGLAAPPAAAPAAAMRAASPAAPPAERGAGSAADPQEQGEDEDSLASYLAPPPKMVLDLGALILLRMQQHEAHRRARLARAAQARAATEAAAQAGGMVVGASGWQEPTGSAHLLGAEALRPLALSGQGVLSAELAATRVLAATPADTVDAGHDHSFVLV